MSKEEKGKDEEETEIMEYAIGFVEIEGRSCVVIKRPDVDQAFILFADQLLASLQEHLRKKKKPKRRSYIRQGIKRLRRALHWKKRFRFYLAGPISWIKDESYMTWREDMEVFLKSIGHEAVNPLKKYSVPAHDKKKVEESILTERINWAREYIRRRVINPDVELLVQSDAIIAYVPKHVIIEITRIIPHYSVGTSSEIFYGYEHNMPVYIVTDIPRRKWSGWFVGLSTLIFGSWDELKRFLKIMAQEGV